MAADTVQLANAWTIVRLSLHVLGATIWVGGQIVLAGLVPTLRSIGSDAPARVARAFARLVWPGFVLLVVTGIWNVAALNAGHTTSSWNAVFGVKMGCVVAAGVGVFLHQRATSATRRGLYGGIGLVATLAAMVLGVALAG